MTPAQDTVLSILESCKTAALGGHLYRCDRCGAEHAAYNSCRNRHCPSCLGHKSHQWLDARAEDLLPVPYFHVVFTVPEPIAALALGNKKAVYNILFRAASQTLLELAANPKHLGADIGFLAILHTWTQTMQHHPHIHCVVPGGGISPDGQRWVGCRDTFFLPVKVLSRLFRGKFLALLNAAARKHDVRFAGTDDQWNELIRTMYTKPWVVYAKPPFGSPEQVLKYLARYTHRVAISNSRIVAMTDTHVTFRYRDRKRNASRTMTLTGSEFLRRFILHVLPKGYVRIRHFGFMANRVRNKRIAQCRSLLGVEQTTYALPTPEDDPGEIDLTTPPKCPTCNLGQLILVGIIDRHITRPSSRGPP